MYLENVWFYKSSQLCYSFQLSTLLGEYKQENWYSIKAKHLTKARI